MYKRMSHVQEDDISLPNNSRDMAWDGRNGSTSGYSRTGSTFPEAALPGKDVPAGPPGSARSHWDGSRTRVMHVSHRKPWVEVREQRSTWVEEEVTNVTIPAGSRRWTRKPTPQ